MATKRKPLKVIPREKAVFRLDKNGAWHLNNERFTNQKIVDYFHSMIKRDADGYFLEQEHRHFIEKVYFPYEDTPLFVCRIIKKDGVTLCLNTGDRVRLEPEKLVQKNDNLYLRSETDFIKFSENALLSLARYMDDVQGRYVITIDGNSHSIPRMG